MSKEYLDYWGLKRDPFHLAPDNEMLYLGGQYYECFERLLYAVNTNKGGALLVSEEAGLGKTTILIKLVNEMKEKYGEQFRYAFVDHPTLTIGQLMAHIANSLTYVKPEPDKFTNIMSIKERLTKLKDAGGKAVIIVDEAHMLSERPDVLQELRILLNQTHNKEYLFTMVLSGQKPLWDTVKGIPEFWQRLPVKYYLMPLKYEETKELITFRLNRAGGDEDREIFSREAIEIINRFAKGLPRTIVALCDLSLLIGSTYHTRKIGFKEVSKAIHAMSGKGEGESLPYVMEKKKEDPSFLRSLLQKIRNK